MERKDFYDALTSYENISKMLKIYEYEEILEQAASVMEAAPQALEAFPTLEDSDGKGSYEWVLKDLQKNVIHFDRLYARLGDEISRVVFANLTGFRVLPAPSFLKQAHWMSQEEEAAGKYDFIKEIDLIAEKRYIRDHFPPLSFDVSRKTADIWEKPALLDGIRPDYSFRLRHYGSSANRQTYFYAVPSERKRHRRTGRKEKVRVVAMAPYERGWSNGELLKDCGLVPYLLYKNHGCDVTMVGAPMEDDSNLKYIEGVHLEFLPDGTQKSKDDYIRREAKEIDVLLLRGIYPDYLPVVELYKKHNPEGKVYLPLDANSAYMDRIQWQKPFIREFMERCDVVAASGTAMQKHLNEKWPWVIENIPNGFYNFSDKIWNPEFEKKKDIVLTVGRLGTEQKATSVLLEAFAEAADQLPGWELHLAGSIEKGFESYLEWFWGQFPELRGRVCFLGQITDKEKLYEEYLQAKVFALTSAWEGGTPNVIAEALYAGDAVVTTKIDEYEDAIDRGRCGMAAEIGDVAGVRDILINVCRSEKLEEMCCHAYEYAREYYDMERIVKKVYYLLFGEDMQDGRTVL